MHFTAVGRVGAATRYAVVRSFVEVMARESRPCTAVSPGDNARIGRDVAAHLRGSFSLLMAYHSRHKPQSRITFHYISFILESLNSSRMSRLRAFWGELFYLVWNYLVEYRVLGLARRLKFSFILGRIAVKLMWELKFLRRCLLGNSNVNDFVSIGNGVNSREFLILEIKGFY